MNALGGRLSGNPTEPGNQGEERILISRLDVYAHFEVVNLTSLAALAV